MIPSDEDLEQMPPLPAENIEAVITNNLVLFRSIGGLQEQNQKLLKIVRELGAKMEAEEKDYREAMDMEQGEAVREAHEAIQDLVAQLEGQKKGSETTIQAYMKERDTLRSMLARAERTAIGAAPSIMPNGEVNGYHEGDSTDLAKELADVQSQFQTYRTEMGVDSVRLREEVIMVQREAGQLGASLAKANAKIEYLNGTSRAEWLVLLTHFSPSLIVRSSSDASRGICLAGP
jgi:nucleoprotein TPR